MHGRTVREFAMNFLSVISQIECIYIAEKHSYSKWDLKQFMKKEVTYT